MKRILFIGLLLAALAWTGLAVAPVALAETVYVRARSAQIRSGRTVLDRVLERVRRGTALEVLEKDERWLLVKTPKGNEGWVYASRTSPEEPEKDAGLLARLGEGLRGDAARTAASAGARGLDKVAEGYARRAGVTAAHIDAINGMEKFSARIGEKNVEDFLRKGKVGEYR